MTEDVKRLQKAVKGLDEVIEEQKVLMTKLNRLNGVTMVALRERGSITWDQLSDYGEVQEDPKARRQPPPR
jgi:hypothetical protein